MHTSSATEILSCRALIRQSLLFHLKLGASRFDILLLKKFRRIQKTKNASPQPEVRLLKNENENEWLQKVRSFVFRCARDSTWVLLTYWVLSGFYRLKLMGSGGKGYLAVISEVGPENSTSIAIRRG